MTLSTRSRGVGRLHAGKRWAAGLLLLGLLAHSGVAAAQEPSLAGERAAGRQGELEEIERAMRKDAERARALAEEIETLRREIRGLRRDMTSAARKAQDLEEKLTTGETRLKDLETRRATKLTVLEGQHEQLARTLAALQRIARRPPEAVIAAPGSPSDTYRSALLLSRAIPEIEDQADALRSELQALDDLRQQIAREQQAMAAAGEALTEERGRLTEMLAQKRRLEDAASAERRAARARIEKWAQEADSLRDFLTKLEDEAEARAERERVAAAEREAAERRAATLRLGRSPSEIPGEVPGEIPGEASGEAPGADSGTPGGAEAPGAAPQTPAGVRTETQTAALAPPSISVPLEKPVNVRAFPGSPDQASLVMPARGRLTGLFGESSESGADELSQGISIETRALAQVVAPYDGRIAYAGAFRRYGQILIIEHGGRYHTLLAGLSQVYAVEGQWVLAGEPVGTMGDGDEATPTLYLELRQSGQPINPLPWLATTDNKVQG